MVSELVGMIRPLNQLVVAERLAAMGLSVIPVHHPSDTRGCGDPQSVGKLPMIEWKKWQSAHPTSNNIREWFGSGCPRNVGIVTGAISGLVVVDLDSAPSLRWAEDHLPPTPMRVMTARGEHWYFRHPGAPVRNRVRIAADSGKLAIDIRADGGFVVGPGSLHHTGHEYLEIEPWPSSLEPVPTFDTRWFGQPASAVSTIRLARRAAGQDADLAVSQARGYLAKTSPAIAGEGGDTRAFDVACALVRGFGLGDDTAVELMLEWNERCVPPWAESDLVTKLANARQYGSEPIGGRLVSTFSNTDASVASSFAAEVAGQYRFNHRLRQGLLFRPPVWVSDTTREGLLLLTGFLQRRAIAIVEDQPHDSAAVRAAGAMLGARRLENLFSLAQAQAEIALTGDELDRDPWIVAAANVVVDLRTGQPRPGRPEDYLVYQLGTHHNSTARCPMFEAFLEQVFEGNGKMVAFLQRLVGYMLTGSTKEQVFVCFHGETGANGKSVLLNTLNKLFGSYALTLPFASFTSDAERGSSASPDLAIMPGRRLVSTSEATVRAKFNESRIKQLSGGDRVSARQLHCPLFEFTPVAKLLFVFNEAPRVAEGGPSFWRRALLVPFRRRFAVQEQDKNLESKLLNELPGILNWAIAGCIDWQVNGLNPPNDVTDAVDQWQEESDAIAEFLGTGCEPAPEQWLHTGELYRAFRIWAEGEQLEKRDVVGRRTFSKRVALRLQSKRGPSGDRGFIGVKPRVR